MTPAPHSSGDLPALPGGPPEVRSLARAADPTVLIPVEEPPALSARVTPGALLRALGRCWPVAVPVGLVLAAVAAAATWAARPDKYTSASLIRVLPASASRLLADEHRPAEAGNGYMRTQIALLRSRPVLQGAMKEEKVRQQPILLHQENPVEWLEKELRAEQIDGTELIRVSLTVRGDGSGLASILNAVVDSHLEMVTRTEQAAQKALLNDLQKVHAERDESVRKLRDTIQSLSQGLKGGDPQVLVVKQTTLLNHHATVVRELSAAESRLRELEVRRERLQRQLAPPADGAPPPAPDPAVVDALVERDLEVDLQTRTWAAELTKLKGDADALGARAVDPANPALARIREKLEAAAKKLDAAREARRAVVAGRQAASARAAALAAAQDTQAELELVTRQRDDLRREAQKVNSQVEQYGLSSVELERRRGEVEQSEALVRILYEQKERLGIELNGANRQRVIVLAKAEAATVPNPLGRVQEAAGAGLAGLVLGLLAVSFREARRNRIHHAADVARGLRLPVVGALPATPVPSLAETLRLAGPSAGRYGRGLVESVDALRTKLLRTRSAGRCPVVMVASPAAGEGKTTLAAQLAASLARAGYATLLVDGDLRRPSLHGLFGVDRAPGLCDLLAGEYGADAAIRPTPVDGLHLLPAGVLTPRASAGMAQAGVPALFDGLRARYDFVVLDTSPLLLVSDAYLLGRSADGVILSVRPGVSQAADVYAAYQQVVEHGLPFTGVVVNGVPGPARYAEAYEAREVTAVGPAAGDPA